MLAYLWILHSEITLFGSRLPANEAFLISLLMKNFQTSSSVKELQQDYLFLQDKSGTKSSCKDRNPQPQVNCSPISSPSAIMYDKWQVDWREEKDAFFPSFTAPSRTNLSRVAVSQDTLSLFRNNDLTSFISPSMQPPSISLTTMLSNKAKHILFLRDETSCWEKPGSGIQQLVHHLPSWLSTPALENGLWEHKY